MTDEAKLVLAVDATQPKQAATTLDELAAAGARAEAATDKLSKTTKVGADATMQFQKAWFDGKNTIDNSTLSIINASSEVQKLIDRYDPLGAKLRTLEKDFKALSDAAKRGLIPDASSGNVDQAYARINAEISKTKSLMGDVGDVGAKGFKSAEDAATKSMFATVQAKRELIVLGHEAMTGNFSRMPGSMLVLAEYTHFTEAMFSALNLTIAGVAVGLLSFYAAMAKGVHDQKAMNDALIMSGNYAGVTGDQLNELAHKATKAGGSLNVAKTAVEDLAASGKFTGEQIETVATSVTLMEAAVSKSTDKTIKQFETLAVESTGHTSRAADSISRATLKLDDSYHFLTLSVYNNIRALELEGQQKEASKLATDEFARATQERSKEIMDNLGDVAKAWNAVKNAVNGAIDAVGNVGKKRTAASDLADAQSNVGSLSGEDDQYGLAVGLANKDKLLAEAKDAVLDATKRLLRENDNALAQGERMQTQSEAMHAAQQLDLQMKSLQKKSQGELATAMIEYHERIELIRKADVNDARVQAEAITAGEEAITKAYGERAKKGIDAYGSISATIRKHKEDAESAIDTEGKLTAADRFHNATIIAIDEAMRKGNLTYQGRISLLKDMDVAEKAMRDQADVIQKTKDEAAAVKELETNINLLYNAGMREVEATERQISKLEAHNSEIGKSKEQIDLIRAARAEQSAVDDEVAAGLLREAALIAGDYHDAYLGYAKDLEAVAANKRKIANLDRDGALLEKGATLAKEQAAEWAKNWKDINKLGNDVFVEWGMNGENMAKKIGDMLKKALLSAIYEATLKPLVFQMYTSVMGGAPEGTKGVQNLVNGVNGASSLNTLWGAGSQLFTGATAGASTASLGYANLVGATGGDAMGAFIAANGGWVGVGTGTGIAATTGGTAVGGAAGIGSGTVLGGGTATGAAAGTGASSGLAAIPGWGWAAIAALAIISQSGYKVDAKGNALTATLGADGLPSGQVGTRSDFEQTGGWFGGGTTQNSSWGVADQGVTDYISNNVQLITASNRKYGEALGLTSDKIDDFTKNIDVNITGMDAAAQKAAIDGELAKFGAEQFAAAYGDVLATVAKSGETTEQTYIRLTSDLTGVNNMFDALGYQLYEVGVAGGAAASGLATTMGGLAAMQQQMASYQQAYYTSAEQRQLTAQSISKTLGDAGLNITTDQILAGTRADGRAAVDAAQAKMMADPTDTQAQSQYAALMKVSSAYATLNPTIDEANKALSDQKAATQAATQAIGGGGGGGGGGESLTSALTNLTDSIYEEVNRIRGLTAGESVLGFVEAQYNFATGTASARSGNQDALKALPKLSQDLLRLAESNAVSLVELNYIRGMTAASLLTTASMNGGTGALPSFDVGTDNVPHDMIAKVHKGEKITPAKFNDGNAALVTLLESIDQRLTEANLVLDRIREHAGKTSEITEKSDTIGPAPTRAAL